MTPSPLVKHQDMVAGLFAALRSAVAGTPLKTVLGPADLHLPNPISGTDCWCPTCCLGGATKSAIARLPSRRCWWWRSVLPLHGIDGPRPQTRDIQRAGIPSY
ncbi:MAG: hypothetical protein ACOYEV_03720 [Candidatus Nanopelagicales bacterium]